MKNFIYGLICGLILASVLLAVNNESHDARPLKLHEPSEEIDRKPSSKPEDEIKKQNSISTFNIAKVQKKEDFETTFSQEVPVNSAAFDNIPGKEKIIGMLDNFSADDMARIESILKHLNDKTPDELFDSESIDANWSLKKQAELEYTFYEQSALKDIGTLESIQCKSQTCLVRVQVAVDLELKPSHYMDWSNPVSVSISPHQSDSNYKAIEIYISRD